MTRYFAILRTIYNQVKMCCYHRFWLRKLTDPTLQLDLDEIKQTIKENEGYLLEKDSQKRDTMQQRYQ